MLVLSRKVGQRISIGDNITLVIKRVSGNRLTLGIEAPENVRILRGELQHADQLPLPKDAHPRSAPTTEASQGETPLSA